MYFNDGQWTEDMWKWENWGLIYENKDTDPSVKERIVEDWEEGKEAVRPQSGQRQEDVGGRREAMAAMLQVLCAADATTMVPSPLPR